MNADQPGFMAGVLLGGAGNFHVVAGSAYR
jgi:hypothetical protein